MPRERTPQAPQAPCTETAPTGSSILSFSSTKKTLKYMMIPAIAPKATAAQASTKAQGAVMATRPASMPLQERDGSGFPMRIQAMIMAATAPAAEASIVFVAITPICGSDEESVEPGLNPNQPKA